MSGSNAARAAVVLGALAVAAIPAGIAATWLLKDVRLLEAIELGVPVAFALGLGAVAAARRARYGLERSVRRQGEGAVRLGRLLAWAGLYFAVTGAAAL